MLVHQRVPTFIIILAWLWLRIVDPQYWAQILLHYAALCCIMLHYAALVISLLKQRNLWYCLVQLVPRFEPSSIRFVSPCVGASTSTFILSLFVSKSSKPKTSRPIIIFSMQNGCKHFVFTAVSTDSFAGTSHVASIMLYHIPIISMKIPRFFHHSTDVSCVFAYAHDHIPIKALQVLVCCGLEAVGGSEPEATAVFLAEGCVVCWQSSDAQRRGAVWSCVAGGCGEDQLRNSWSDFYRQFYG